MQYTTFTPVQLQNQTAKLNIAAAKSSLIIQKMAFILFLIDIFGQALNPGRN